MHPWQPITKHDANLGRSTRWIGDPISEIRSWQVIVWAVRCSLAVGLLWNHPGHPVGYRWPLLLMDLGKKHAWIIKRCRCLRFFESASDFCVSVMDLLFLVFCRDTFNPSLPHHKNQNKVKLHLANCKAGNTIHNTYNTVMSDSGELSGECK